LLENFLNVSFLPIMISQLGGPEREDKPNPLYVKKKKLEGSSLKRFLHGFIFLGFIMVNENETVNIFD